MVQGVLECCYNMPMAKGGNFWKIGFILLFIILLGIIGYLAYSYGKGKISPTGTPSVSTTPSPTAFPQVQDETKAIKNAVYAKLGSDENKLQVTISQIEGNYAKGGIKELEAVGGAYFLAAKVEGVWRIVYDGQASPFCSDIASYNFPQDMVPECLDANAKVIRR